MIKPRAAHYSAPEGPRHSSRIFSQPLCHTCFLYLYSLLEKSGYACVCLPFSIYHGWTGHLQIHITFQPIVFASRGNGILSKVVKLKWGLQGGPYPA